MNRRPGQTTVTTEVAMCSFCGRPRTLRREEHRLGTLVRTIVTCESCHRTLSSTMGVAAEEAQPAAAPAEVPAPVPEPAPAAEAAPKRKRAAAAGKAAPKKPRKAAPKAAPATAKSKTPAKRSTTKK